MLKLGRVYKQSSEFRFNLETISRHGCLTGRSKVHEFVAGKKGHTLIAMSFTLVVGTESPQLYQRM